jgi:cell division protein FtsZ
MHANIKVLSVGKGGSRTITRMIEAGVAGVEFLCLDTDAQDLDLSLAPRRLLIGGARTQGLGADADPEVGRGAAEESRAEIQQFLVGAEMVFVTAGMGGGTGTGGAPVVAEIARESGALTVGLVTKPFTFEGPRRMRVAEAGIANLRRCVDTLITIPCDRLLPLADRRTSLQDAWRFADDVQCQCARGISDLLTISGLINVEFGDVKAILANAGTAVIGIGTGRGEKRALEAAEWAIASPLLETSIEGARGVLLNITAGPDLMLEEVQQAADVISNAADLEDALLIFGAVINPEMGEDVRVTVVATGFRPDAAHPARLVPLKVPPHRPGRSIGFPPPTTWEQRYGNTA